MDASQIGALIAGIKHVSDIAIFMRGSKVALQDAEYAHKVAELLMALADLKSQAADIKMALIEKDELILSLQQRQARQVVFERPYYFDVTDGNKDGPFCPTCRDSTDKLIRLENEKKGAWQCHVCKTYLRDKDYRPPNIDDGGNPYV